MQASSHCRFAALAALALVFSLTAYAQQTLIIKFSHVVAIDAPKGKAAERIGTDLIHAAHVEVGIPD